VSPARPSHSSFQQFFKTEAAGGLILIACAAAALIVANSPFADAYHALWTLPFGVDVAGHRLELTLHQWINDGLMAVFFFLVGLEIKREIVAGELASPRQAALPIAGAIGGMVVPAILYVIAAGGGPEARGWAVPMATDIAFALGALAILAPRAPGGLKVFLAALAIVDDMGAVLVIAVFYSADIMWSALGEAGMVLIALVALNRCRVRALWPYLLLGLVLWYFVHESGVHATIAGVLLAFTIPTRTRINAAEFSEEARELLDEFDRTETGDLLVITSKGQQEAVVSLERASERVMAPLLRIEHNLHAFTAFVVMPLFAFSNAGVTLAGASIGGVTLAVLVGLVIGKPLGITAAAALAVRLKLAALPQGVTWLSLHGCAWLGGIGFTMSLFIAALAFEGTPLLDSAKVGILAASLLAAVVAAVVLRRTANAHAAA
jgi:Na+:H+ antiporter, NhaA family